MCATQCTNVLWQNLALWKTYIALQPRVLTSIKNIHVHVKETMMKNQTSWLTSDSNWAEHVSSGWMSTVSATSASIHSTDEDSISLLRISPQDSLSFTSSCTCDWCLSPTSAGGKFVGNTSLWSANSLFGARLAARESCLFHRRQRTKEFYNQKQNLAGLNYSLTTQNNNTSVAR